MKWSGRVEIAGIALVLAAIALQTFLVDPLESVALRAQATDIRVRQETIWTFLASLGGDLSGEQRLRQYLKLNESWRKVQESDSRFEVQEELHWVAGGLFIFGSILVGAGRYGELSKKPQRNLIPESPNAPDRPETRP